jgi:hypothetical protein
MAAYRRNIRRDIDRVIIERPRKSGLRETAEWLERHRLDVVDPEEGEQYARKAKRTRSRGGTKFFDDFLAPLYGFFAKNVGRPWSKVYGELRRAIDHRTLRGHHLLVHVRGYVAENVAYVKDGVPHDARGDTPYQKFYVHPKTGLLARSEAYTQSYLSEPGAEWKSLRAHAEGLLGRPWSEVVQRLQALSPKRKRQERLTLEAIENKLFHVDAPRRRPFDPVKVWGSKSLAQPFYLDTKGRLAKRTHKLQRQKERKREAERQREEELRTDTDLAWADLLQRAYRR